MKTPTSILMAGRDEGLRSRVRGNREGPMPGSRMSVAGRVALALLLASAAAYAQDPAAAPKGRPATDVTIVAPLPVPVTVDNPTPIAVTGTISGEVSVNNGVGNPVPVTAVSPIPVRLGITPYQHVQTFSSGTAECDAGTSICLIDFAAVPAGKQLVIEHLTMLVYTPDTVKPAFLALGTTITINSSNVAVLSPEFIQSSLSGTTFWSMDRPLRVYYGPGSTPTVKLVVAGGLATFVSSASLHGYLVDATP